MKFDINGDPIKSKRPLGFLGILKYYVLPWLICFGFAGILIYCPTCLKFLLSPITTIIEMLVGN